MIYREAARAQENLVLTNELHLLYLVTPLDLRDSPELEWMIYFKQVGVKKYVLNSEYAYARALLLSEICSHLKNKRSVFPVLIAVICLCP